LDNIFQTRKRGTAMENIRLSADEQGIERGAEKAKDLLLKNLLFKKVQCMMHAEYLYSGARASEFSAGAVPPGNISGCSGRSPFHFYREGGSSHWKTARPGLSVGLLQRLLGYG
jgi:hypothetical protein